MTFFPKKNYFFAGIAVLFKDTTMCMHHKFCLIDTREKTASEKRQTEALLAAIKRKEIARENQRKLKTTIEKNGSLSSDTRKNSPKSTVTIPEQGICITGSCNWTMQGFASNWENVILTSNKIMINAFRQEFDRIWQDFRNAQTITNMSEVKNPNF